MGNMFCFQCQETCGNSGCTNVGACGKTAVVANLMDRLIYQLKGIALNRKVSHELAMFIARSLFMTISNTVFCEKTLTSRLRRAEKLAGVSLIDIPCGANALENEDMRSLAEFVTYSLKGISAYMVHADELDRADESLDDFLFYALRKTVECRDFNEMTELLLECGQAAVKAMSLLDAANTESFGNTEKTSVRTSVGRRPGILVSGHDLRDLYELLVQTENKNIDIYTHSEMLIAHAYPLLKKFPHLYGNYGSAWHRQNIEFASFNGPILLTSNCITPVQDSYKNRIFTTGCCHYHGVPYIEDRETGLMKDFSPLIEFAVNCNPPLPIDDNELLTGFGHAQLAEYADELIKNIHNGSIRWLVVMAGCDGRHKTREYYSDVATLLGHDTVILTAGCAKYRYNRFSFGEINGLPRLLDAGQCNDSYSLVLFALRLKEKLGVDDINKLPISFDIAWYEQKAVAILLALLSLGFKNIRLGPTLPAFVSEKVLRLLEKQFKLRPISQAHTDIADMMKGR